MNAAPIAPAISLDHDITTDTVEIRRDGVYVASGINGWYGIMAFFHLNTSQSVEWALKHEGYTIHEQAERFVIFAEKAGEPETIIAIKDTIRKAKLATDKFGKSAESDEYRAYGWRREIARDGVWSTL